MSQSKFFITILVSVVLLNSVQSQDNTEFRTISIDQGLIRGYKEDGIFIYYSIPYATAPTGVNKFKAPLDPPTWQDTYEAVDKDISCPQFPIPGIEEDCLIATVFAPDTNTTNLPVVVVVHGGAFVMGHGNELTPKNLVQSERVVAVTFNYRLGIHGFLCLGTEMAPGNAAMKDQVVLLRWVNKNIAYFGGNPEDVTITGCSAGGTSVDLLMLSDMAKGLFHKVIPACGASVASWALQMDPIKEAKEHARISGFSDVDDVNSLESFYTSASWEILLNLSYILYRPDGSVGFVSCVERDLGQERFLADAPVNIIKQGAYNKVPVLYGFAEKEGLFRIESGHYDVYQPMMNDKFSDFLPPDLQFSDESEMEKVAADVKQFYFGNNDINYDTIDKFVDYFTDTMFAYGVLKSVKLHLEGGHDKVYLYEYSFDAEEYPPVLENLRGASHCHQIETLLNGVLDSYNISTRTQEMRDNLQELWINFITMGTPVVAGSSFPAWPAVTSKDRYPCMSINSTLESLGTPIPLRAQLWDGIYDRYYLAPVPPSAASMFFLSSTLLFLIPMLQFIFL